MLARVDGAQVYLTLDGDVAFFVSDLEVYSFAGMLPVNLDEAEVVTPVEGPNSVSVSLVRTPGFGGTVQRARGQIIDGVAYRGVHHRQLSQVPIATDEEHAFRARVAD